MPFERDPIRRDQTVWRKKLKGAIHLLQDGAFKQPGQKDVFTPELLITAEERPEVETPEAYPGNIIWLAEYRKVHKKK